MSWWIICYWALAASALGGSALLTWHTWEHRRFVRSRIAHPDRRPSELCVALVVPCKGAETDLEAHLRPLFEQDFTNYLLTFVVESREDSACPIIERLIVQYPARGARLIVAGVCTSGGQKVHNLLAATAEIPSQVTALAFADTDIRPPRDWLRLLTQRLNHRAASTGYRCFIPRKNTTANAALAGINAATTGMMFPGRHHLVWGGSWAVRREVFEASRLREAWQGTLSDDMIAMRVLARAKARVAFEPACIVPSPLDMDWRGVMSFLRRQLSIGRCCAPGLWTITLAYITGSQLAFWGSAAAALWRAAIGGAWAPLAAVAGGLYMLGVLRAWLRQSAASSYLPDHQQALATVRRTDIWLGPLVGLVLLAGLVSSGFGRRITWRGITYEMRVGGRAWRVTPTLGDANAAASNRQQAA